MPEANGSVTIRDYANQKSSVGVNLQNMDNAGTNAGSLLQDLDEFKDAIDPIVNGAIEMVRFTVAFAETGQTPASQSSREKKWLVTYKDTTQYLDAANLISNPGYNKTFDFEIPCADWGLLPAGTEILSLSVDPGLAFKTAVTPNLRSPHNRAAGAGVTPTVEVIQVKKAGRNL